MSPTIPPPADAPGPNVLALGASIEQLEGENDRLRKALTVLLNEAENFSVSGVYFNEPCFAHKGPEMAHAVLNDSSLARSTAWLVESLSSRPACYLEGFDLVTRMGTMGHDPSWTADHLKALRFSRKSDAEKIAQALHHPGRAADHVWIGGRKETP